MLALIIYGLILSAAMNIGQCMTGYKPISGGWIKSYRNLFTWQEAFERCQKDGAMIASPSTRELLNEMQSMVTAHGFTTPFYTGITSFFHPDRYVSLEGVPLDDMETGDLCDQVDSQKGQCMSMDHTGLHVVPCSYLLPVICYKRTEDVQQITDCGTSDPKYKFESSTGSCYKIHLEKKIWQDAFAHCLDEGGYLAVMNDNNEVNKVKSLLFNHHNGLNYVHIGIRQLEPGKPWVSVRGGSVIQTDVFNEIYSPKTVYSKHAQIGLLGRQDSKWARDVSDVAYAFICEKDPADIKFPMY